MFTMYRNSTKKSENLASLNLNSPSTADVVGGSVTSKASHSNAISQAKSNSSHFNMMYSTARNAMHHQTNQGFYQADTQ